MSKKLTFDPAHLRERILRRLGELNKSARGASREAGLGESTIRNLMEGKSASPRLDTIVRLAKVLEVQPDWFLASAIDENGIVYDKISFDGVILHAAPTIPGDPQDLEDFGLPGDRYPLYVPRNIENGLYEISNRSSYFISVAEFKKTNKRQYVFNVRNRDMNPVFRFDDLLFIDPLKDLKEDEDYLFFKLGPASDLAQKSTALLARLVGAVDDAYRAATLNPPTVFELSRSEWGMPHRVVLRLAQD